MYFYTYNTDFNYQKAPHTIICEELPEGTYSSLANTTAHIMVFDNGTKLVPIRDSRTLLPVLIGDHHGKVFRKGKWVTE